MKPASPTAPTASDSTKPQVVFPSAYRLTADQEKKLLEEATAKLLETERQLGRDLISDLDWWGSGSTDQVNAGSKSFLGRRQIFDMVYRNEVEFRANVKGGIFEESNWIVPVSRRIVSHQVARANAHYFGSDPWFSADINRLDVDADLKKQAERWTRSKFADAGISDVLQSAVESAFIRGEAVVKRSIRETADIFQTEMTVLIDTRTGEPVLDSKGDYIVKGRRVRVERQQQTAPIAPALSEPEVITRDIEMLEDDGTPLPPRENQKYEKRIVERRNVLYGGIFAEECYYKDLLIPLNARDVQSAPHVFHLYETSVADLADQWNREAKGIARSEGEEARNIATRNAVETIKAMEGNRDSYAFTSDPEAGATAEYRHELPEDQAAYQTGSYTGRPQNATAKVVEAWMRFDANDDGILENILLVFDRETMRPIYYDYVANITPDGKRPFSVIRINPVQNRWYGFGSMQVFEVIQNIVDLQMNRWNRSQGESGRVTFWNRHAIEGGETNPDLDLNWGETYQLKEEKTATDALAYVTLPEVKGQDLKAVMDFYLQLAHSMSGVQMPNDVGVQAAEASKTATSIVQMTNAGQEMFGQLLSHLRPGISETCDGLAELAVVHMADEDEYSYQDGEMTQFALFSRSQVGESRLRIRLLLSKFKAEQEKVSISSGLDRAVEFYTLPAPAQARLATAYQAYLRALDFQNPDELIQPLDPTMMGADSAMGGTAMPFGAADPAGPGDQFGGQMQGGMAGGLATNAGAAA